MDKNIGKTVRRTRRRIGIRKRITGTGDRPRMAVYKSLHHIYAQIINDLDGKTLAAASSVEKSLGLTKAGGNAKAASAVGALLAERAKKAGVGGVVFDRGGFKFHGRVKALAEAARKGGLKF